MTQRFSVHLRNPDGQHAELDVHTDHTLLVGRDVACDVVLPSPAVSRFHLEITRDAEGLLVTDRSSNGTLAGDLRVHHSSATVPP
ncbi:MAG: FHA domain-containing protein, partial [Polyangiales bacterium]